MPPFPMQPWLALRYLKQSIKLKKDSSAHINMAAVLSWVGKHRPAAWHAREAVMLLEPSKDPKCPLLASALFCYAVELEHLRLYDQCLHIYEKARTEALKVMGEAHPMTQGIATAHSQAKRQAILAQQRSEAPKFRVIDTRSLSGLAAELRKARTFKDPDQSPYTMVAPAAGVVAAPHPPAKQTARRRANRPSFRISLQCTS
jgi:hypothetical protein